MIKSLRYNRNKEKNNIRKKINNFCLEEYENEKVTKEDTFCCFWCLGTYEYIKNYGFGMSKEDQENNCCYKE